MACPVPCRWECWSTIKAHSTKKALDGDFSSYSITFMRALSTLSPIARKSKDSNSELAGHRSVSKREYGLIHTLITDWYRCWNTGASRRGAFSWVVNIATDK
jgi:hypothetical protein